MALIDNSVVQPGTGHILYREPTQSAPTPPTFEEIEDFATDTTTLPNGWMNYGHTDRDDPLAFGADGGESEVKGSWQNAALRELVTSQAVDYLTIKSLQVGDPVVQADFNGGGSVTVAGRFDAPAVAQPRQKEFLIVMFDAYGAVGLWLPLVSVRKEGPPEVATDDFIKLPIRVTFLQRQGAPRLSWLHRNFVVTP